MLPNTKQHPYYYLEMPMLNKEPFLIPINCFNFKKKQFVLQDTKYRNDLKWCATRLLNEFHYANDGMFNILYSNIVPNLDEYEIPATLSLKDSHSRMGKIQATLFGQILRINKLDSWNLVNEMIFSKDLCFKQKNAFMRNYRAIHIPVFNEVESYNANGNNNSQEEEIVINESVDNSVQTEELDLKSMVDEKTKQKIKKLKHKIESLTSI